MQYIPIYLQICLTGTPTYFLRKWLVLYKYRFSTSEITKAKIWFETEIFPCIQKIVEIRDLPQYSKFKYPKKIVQFVFLRNSFKASFYSPKVNILHFFHKSIISFLNDFFFVLSFREDCNLSFISHCIYIFTRYELSQSIHH